ncbi:MAG: hypothetical protein WCZ23_00325 [Rhodospirillaceae bacterium]
MAHETTRRELYDLIWARPMTKVAAELGISDVALHKICDKHRIPAPGRGYWAKVAAGKPVRRALFRELRDPLMERVRILGGAVTVLPAEVQEARQKAKAAAKARKGNIPVAKAATMNDDPKIIKLRGRLERAKIGDDGFVRAESFAVTVAPPSISRALGLLSLLLAEARALGHAVAADGDALKLVVDGESISICLYEKTDRVPHQPTDKEVAALRKWQLEKERKQRLHQWYGDWDKPRVPEWDQVPNGQLVIEIDVGRHWDGLRRKFGDGKRKRLEAMVLDVLAGAATISAARKAKREEQRRRELERQEEEKRRREAERRRTLEQKRFEFLAIQMERADKARQLEAFVRGYLDAHPPDTLPEATRLFIEWVQTEAQGIRSIMAPERLAARLEHYRLMDDTTEISSWVKIE